MVHEIYDMSWSKTEFCELVPGQKGPTIVLFGSETGFHLSGFANSQNDRQSTKLYYVTLKLGVSRDASASTVIRTAPLPPSPNYNNNKASGNAAHGRTPPLTVVELHQIQIANKF